MAASQGGVLMVAAVILAIFALVGTAAAQEAPTLTPASSAGVATPSFLVGCALAAASIVFGSALKI